MSAAGFGRTVPGRAAQAVPDLRLRCLAGDAVGAVFALRRLRASVGRGDASNGVEVDLDLSRHEASKLVPSVSRLHAEIEWLGDRFIVQDLRSRNGTFVNGDRLAPAVPARIAVGDRLRFGAVEFLVEVDDG